MRLKNLWAVCLLACLAGQVAAQDWNQWRGPGRNGVASTVGLPDSWTPGPAGSENVIWRQACDINREVETANAAADAGSPIVIGGGDSGRVFFMHSMESRISSRMISLRESDGAFLWDRVTQVYSGDGFNICPNNQGAATPYADSANQRLYYGTKEGRLQALNFNGNLLWRRLTQENVDNEDPNAFNVTIHNCGNSTPLPHNDLVIFSLAPHYEEPAESPKLVALNRSTGATVWTQNFDPYAGPLFRLLHGSWSSPVIGTPPDGITRVYIQLADGSVRAVRADDGVLLWTHEDDSGYQRTQSTMSHPEGQGSEGIATPVYNPPGPFEVASGAIYVSAGEDPSHDILAPVGSGRVWKINAQTGQQIWHYPPATNNDLGNIIGSAAVAGNRVYVGDTEGYLHCINATDGTRIWREWLGGGAIWASPTVADGKVYIGTQDGDFYIIEDSDVFNVLDVDNVGSRIASSVAVANGSIYVKSDFYVWKVSTGEGGSCPTDCNDGDPCTIDECSESFVCEHTLVADDDLDGFCNTIDNCPSRANASQSDADADGTGDACDRCTDTDGDGFGNPFYGANTCAIDNCPNQGNPGQEDFDLDGSGDVCDSCTDGDGDGFGNPGFPANTCPADNCPLDSNPDQADANGNGIGDVCDGGDLDNDGLLDASDPCTDDPRNRCYGPVAIDGNSGNPIRVNANSSGNECAGDKIDCNGDAWFSDFGFNTGNNARCNLSPGESCVITGIDTIFGCDDETTEDLFQCERFDFPSNPELEYSFDVPDGNYLVNLLFANTFDGSANVGDRVFDIRIEGALVYDDFDQVAAAGGSGIGVVRSARVTVADGNGLQIELLHVIDNPAIKAIEVLEAAGCTDNAQCDDGNVCTDDICNAGTCENNFNTAPCDDGIACTASDVCGAGVCAGTDSCPADQNCNLSSGVCEGSECILDSDCDDGDACTLDACSIGFCDNSPLPDGDSDGVCDDLDNCPATANADQSDADSDALGDVCDTCTDTDGDGFGDPGFPANTCATDNCPDRRNAGQLDQDADGLGDRCDACDLDPDNDIDGDGVCGDVDNCPAVSNADQADGDADGLGDVCDACPADAANDADSDGICGDVDNCPADANGSQTDSDSDGLGDVCDACPADAANDADSDGICGDVDNCPADANGSQTDSDSDGLGDVCDACPADAANDADSDGICGDVDNCPADANGSQTDSDSDGLGDVCDACPADAANDADSDGICGDVDNCPADANGSQTDSDSDGLGDVCDACPADADNDIDSDGVCGDVDNCPTTPNPSQADSDGDGVGDACDTCSDVDSDGVCDAGDNCPSIPNADQADADSDGAGDVCDACPADPANDADSDGVCGDVDNCPADANAAQTDGDSDGLGDVCDACPADPANDSDSDGVCGDVDNCPTTPNPGQEDTDGDGIGDACDFSGGVDTDNDGMDDGVDPCPVDALNRCYGPVAIDGTEGTPVRINTNSTNVECAGNKVDCNGDIWYADYGFNTGRNSACNLGGGGEGCVISGIDTVFGCDDEETEDIFQCNRWDRQNPPPLEYSFDVPDGSYLVNLLFANSFDATSNPGDRVFDILIEGNLVYDDFDEVVASGGPANAVVRAAVVGVTDGNGIQISFREEVSFPQIKGVEVLAATPGGACSLDTDCNDNDSCTEDLCNTGTGQCSNDPLPDSDSDGFCDAIDNCPQDPNADQSDPDGDGRGAACDALEGDRDNDALADGLDPCPDDARNLCFGPVAIDTVTSSPVRVNAGDEGVCAGIRQDCAGNFWAADNGANSGASSSCDDGADCEVGGLSGLFGCEDGATVDLFECARDDAAGPPDLSYSYSLAPGTYVVNLLWANVGGSRSVERTMDVTINGVLVHDDVAPHVIAGGFGRAVVQSAVVTIVGAEGLTIDFGAVQAQPSISAIEVLSQP